MRAVVIILVAAQLAGCASQNSKMEKAVIAAQFQPQKGTPEVAARLAEYPPYTFLAIKGRGKKEEYAFASPARKTIYLGDKAALSRYAAYMADQQYADYVRAEKFKHGLKEFGRGMAMGVLMGLASMENPYQNQAPASSVPTIAPPPQPTMPTVIYPTTTSTLQSQKPTAVYPTVQGGSIRDYSRGTSALIEDGKVYPTLQGGSLRDFSRGTVGVVEDGKIYPTSQGGGVRDFSRGAVGVVEDGKVYPTMPNSSLRDYSKPAIGVIE